MSSKGKHFPIGDQTLVTINIGDSVTSLSETALKIQCPVSGVPPPKVTWTKDGQLIASGEGVTVNENGTLSVSRTTPGDSGRYMCTASNVGGKDSVTSDVITVGKY